jgi:hypothetical protein
VARRDPGRPRRGVLEIFVGALVTTLGLAALALLIFAVITGRLDADPSLLVGFAVGAVIVIALVVGAVRLVLLAVATPMRRPRETPHGRASAGSAPDPDV